MDSAVVWAAIAVLAGFCLLRYVRRGNSAGCPVVAGGLPILGHAVAFNEDPGAFLRDCKAKYGRAFQTHFLSKRMVFVDGSLRKAYFAAPESVLSFTQGVQQSLVPEYTFGQAVITDPWHVPLIRLGLGANGVAHTFAPSLASQVARCIKRQLPQVEEAPQVCEDLERLAWDLVAHFSSKTFFGSALGNREELLDVFSGVHLSCFKIINAAAVLPKWLARFAAGDMAKHKAVVRAAVAPEVERRLKIIEAGGTLNEDVLTEVIQARVFQKEAANISGNDIADRMVALIFASMVTTAGVLTHVLYDIAGRPEHWARLHAEQKAALSGASGTLDGQFLGALPYLHAFMRESMRLSSLPIQQMRYAVQDTQLDGVPIPKGAFVCVSGVLAHLDETLFPEPTRFDPTRFLNADGSLLADPVEAGFFPFGVGRHVCAGRHFATAEVKIAVTLLMQRYHFTTCSGTVPAYKYKPADTVRMKEPVLFTKLDA